MRRGHWPTWMLLPAVGFLVTAFLGPFLYMVWLSLTDLSFAAAEKKGAFVGLANYVHAFLNDQMFWESTGRSGMFALLCLIPSMVIGVLVAEILWEQPLAEKLLSPLLAFPVLLPGVVVGMYWRLMLQGEFGVISFYLDRLGFSWAKSILSHPKTVLYTLAFVNTWQWGPFVLLVLLAARRSLPQAPIEAAWTDGASRWRAFCDVTLPSLLPTIFALSLIRAIDSFKEFDTVYVITGGGPGSASELSSLYIWRVVFREWNFGYGAALCVVVYFLIYGISRLWIYHQRAGVQ